MRLRQDRLLGCLMGMAIGDALGMPVEGWASESIAARFGSIDGYHGKTFDDDTTLAAGEFTDESEGVLCIIESFTANTGNLDPENIRARMELLARGESRRWMNPSTLQNLDDESISPNRVTGDVAARGIPLGLILAAGSNGDQIREWSGLLAALTHQQEDAVTAIHIVAEAVRAVITEEQSLADLPEYLAGQFAGADVTRTLHGAGELSPGTAAERISKIGLGDEASQVISTAVISVATAATFEDAVFVAASAGGATDARGAIAGALAGARWGTAGIPQTLIDGLEGRVYVMLAAPWFYQTIQLKAAFGGDR